MLSLIFSTAYADQFACNNTFIPSQCQGSLFQECQYNPIRGNDLNSILNNVEKVCANECGLQFVALDACLKSVGHVDNVTTVCRDTWNVRCSRIGTTYCYIERLQYWINKGYTQADVVNNDIKSGGDPGIPCTDCQRTMLSYETDYDNFMLTIDPEMFSWSRANKQIATQTCGNNFLSNYTVNTQIFNGVNDGQAQQNSPLNIGLIVGLSVASLVLLVASIVGFMKYRTRKAQFFNPRRRDSVAQLSQPVLGKFEDSKTITPPKSNSSEGRLNSKEMDEYYVSKPFAN